MRRIIAILAVSGLVATPLQAATDPGLMLHDTYASSRQIGVGARASVTIPLGADPARARRTVLAIDAGPATSRAGSAVRVGDRFRVAPLTRLAVRPAYDVQWTVAGKSLAQVQSPAALRDERRRPTTGEQRNISNVGIVAIGVGVAAIIGGLLFIDAMNDASD